MSRPPTFSELMESVRRGDVEALDKLLFEYGDAVRREARFTLLDTRLRRFIGESDIYQTVVMRFVAGLREGNFLIDSPEDLIRLLKGIARTRVAELVRYWHAQRRNLSREADLKASGTEQLSTLDAGPLELLAQAESLQQVNSRLSALDQKIFAWRDVGQTWSEIAARLDATSADAVRKQHERALAKVAADLDGKVSSKLG